MQRIAPRPEMTVRGMVRDYPLRPEQMVRPVTRSEDLFVLAHMGIPEIDATGWSLEVCGLVERPLKIGVDDLRRLPKRTLEAIHKCAGSPVNPRVPTRQIANVVWGGIELRDLLAEAGVREDATHLWAWRLDHGRYRGVDQPHYVKDLPLARIAAGDALLAWELNGAPLSARHGHPARLVVPGFYGTNSVKWLCRLEVADRRAEGLFTTTLYNDPAPDGGTRPVWEVAPESLIVAPARGEAVGGTVTIWGWAWSATEVAAVEVSTDGGASWREADLGRRRQRSWQRFSLDWTPGRSGPHVLQSRARDADGRTQPAEAARNAVYSVEVVTG